MVRNAPIVSLQSILGTGPATPAADPTSADRQALENFAANNAALRIRQPLMVERAEREKHLPAWMFGRDGFLTARGPEGWWAGTSVSLFSGRELLKTLDLVGTVGCFLCPSHAGQLRACFERIQFNQAIIAVVPDPLALAVILHCDDFSSEIAAGRLLFAGGWDWSDQLAAVFRENPGLPIPQNYIRTNLLDDAALTVYSTEAQGLVAAENQRRAERIGSLNNAARSRTRGTSRVLVIAGSGFRIGDLSGAASVGSLLEDEPTEECAFVRLDPDHPTSASPLALAEAAASVDAIVTANLFRQDLGSIAAETVPWITWVTNGRIIAPQSNCPKDGLLLVSAGWADASRMLGWAADRIATSGWPSFVVPKAPETAREIIAPRPKMTSLVSVSPLRRPPAKRIDKAPTVHGVVGLFSDTTPLDAPQSAREFSSHLLLWETIAEDLLNHPLIMGSDSLAYLNRKRGELGIAEEGFNAGLFLEKLILPAYHQGLARAMIRAMVAPAIFGAGWLDLPEFHDHAAGPVTSMAGLSVALGGCAAVLHPFPSGLPHAVDAMGLAVIRCGGLSMEALLQTIRNACRGKTTSENSLAESHPLSRGRVLSLAPTACWAETRDAEFTAAD